jgi:hypothetical protein
MIGRRFHQPTAMMNLVGCSKPWARPDPDIGQYTVKDEVKCITVFSETDKPLATEKAVQASIQRPIGVRVVVSIGRFQKLPRERINVVIGQ